LEPKILPQHATRFHPKIHNYGGNSVARTAFQSSGPSMAAEKTRLMTDAIQNPSPPQRRRGTIAKPPAAIKTDSPETESLNQHRDKSYAIRPQCMTGDRLQGVEKLVDRDMNNQAQSQRLRTAGSSV
jgi:hypothetical protein